MSGVATVTNHFANAHLVYVVPYGPDSKTLLAHEIPICIMNIQQTLINNVHTTNSYDHL